ncbi:MAG: MFS transporter [Chloroflexi bacterium]|nr:MFS transporter [Chloroflexota bacterium]
MSLDSSVSIKRPRTVAYLVGYYAAFIGLGLMSAILGPTLPGLAAQTRTTLSEISVLFVAKSVGYIAGSLLSGRLYDRLPGHPILALAVLLATASLILIPFTPLLWVLFVVILALGMAEAAIDVGGNTLLVWVFGEKVGPYMNGLHFMFGAGAAIAPLIVARVILLSGGITWAFWVLAFLVFPAALWVSRVPSPAAHVAARAAREDRVNYVLVALVAAFFFLYVGAEVGFGSWIFTYATRLKLADEATAAYLTSAFWGALTAGRLLAIPVAARLRPRTILAIDLLGCLFSVGLILGWADSAVAVWVGAGGLGLFMASVFPTTLTFVERRMTITGGLTSLFFVGGSLGAMFLPWLIGQLFERAGPPVTMMIVFSALLLDAVVFVALMIYAPRRSQS